jgi:two-component system, OmpR family, sensor kinase
LTGDDLEERARRIRAAVQRIVRLIDNLVDTARLADGDARLFFHPEPMGLAAVLRDVCSKHRELSPCMQIFEDYGNPPLPIEGDPSCCFNAIKYSAHDATVMLRARQTPGQTFVSVEDHGIGIPEADQARIFTRYYRGTDVAGYVGTGSDCSLSGLWCICTAGR